MNTSNQGVWNQRESDAIEGDKHPEGGLWKGGKDWGSTKRRTWRKGVGQRTSNNQGQSLRRAKTTSPRVDSHPGED